MNRPLEPLHGTDVLAALRAATGARHTRLDSGLPLSADHPTLADYAAHLRMLRDWLAPLERWLAGFTDGPQAEPTLPPQDRLALIAADLDEPGMDAAHAGGRAPTPVPARPRQASAAYRWGAAYVIEGSQLGGAVLYARLCGPLAPHPLRYLRGEAQGPGPRWRAFLQALRARVTTSEEIAECCAGACAAFDAILALAPPQGATSAP